MKRTLNEFPDMVATTKKKCPYLDTINRQFIDFDSEKLCSVTLTNMNVYACLVCGKFFQGRGKLTPAYTHSVQLGHFVFMNMSSARTYCLPDGYEVIDSSLVDIEKCLCPTFKAEEMEKLNTSTLLARDIYGVSYLPGFIGFNNLNATDFLNVILHALGHVSVFRDYWLQMNNYSNSKNSIVKHFGLVIFCIFVQFFWNK
jgi:U4/U6.U5 tri-snRNP-associated protein 2